MEKLVGDVALSAIASDIKSAIATKADAQATAEALATKADTSAVNSALATKADKSSVYTKTETDNKLSVKANTSDVDTALALKADKSDTYTKQSVDDKLALKESITDLERDYYNKTQVDNIINNLPEPMVFKGTLGVNGTITSLPTASASNEGYTYKVITDGTYAGQSAKSGDVFVSNGSAWVLIPSGDEDNDTWRAIKVNGVEKLGNAISSGSVDFVDTDNVKFSFEANGNKVKATLSGIDTSAQVDEKVAGIIDDTEASESKAYSSSKVAELLGNKADVDGTYDNMTVGNAKQLKSNVGEVDKVPYLFRTSGGSIDIGESETDMLVGGTVAFNQLANFAGSSRGVIASIDSNGVISLSGTSTSGFANITSGISVIKNHKYIIGKTIIANPNNITIRWGMLNVNYSPLPTETASTKWHIVNMISDDATSSTGIAGFSSGTDFTGVKIKLLCVDLTQMFGSTIADYIYSLEQGTAGAGVAWFRNLFPKSYYAYNAGTLMSVKTSKHITTGFNQWDEEWELGGIDATTGQNTASTTNIRSKNYIAVVPNTTYYFNTASQYMYLRLYDEDKNYLGEVSKKDNTYAIDSNTYYIRFVMGAGYGTTYNHDICINLSWDGERNGEYEPYVKHEYPLDDDLELRGIPKLDANNKLYYDGDTYESDGTVTRKYGYVDMGTLDWEYSSSRFEASLTNVKKGSTRTPFVCAKYPFTGLSGSDDKTGFIGASGTLKDVYIYDSAYTSAATFKTAMSGVYLVYELATPTTEEADTFTNPQKVDDFGTEEYEDNRTVPIPVGHDTFYQSNLRAKLEMSPDSPSGDGDYIVRQTNGQNEYVAFVKELPTLPSTDGTYTLKCTVSGSTKTLSWVADT